MSQKFVQTQAIALYTGISAAATSMVVTPYPRDIQTNAKLTFSDFGTSPSATIDPKIPGYEEIITFTGITDNGDDTATLTGLTRNLIGQSPYSTPGTGKQHGSSAVVVFSDNPQLYNRLASKENDELITGSWSFPVPVSGSNPATKSYVDALVFGGSTTVDRLVVVGTAGETLSIGNVIYLKASDGRWWKAKANVTTTSEILQLGIAQGAGTAGVAISGGVLLRGADPNQSGGSAGALGYVSDAGGAVATTTGTLEKVIGNFITATIFDFNPDFYYIPTASQKGAMGTINVAPSNTNKFLTQNELGAAAPLTIPLGESFTGATTPQPAAIINDLSQPFLLGYGTLGWADGSHAVKLATKIIPRSNITAQSLNAILSKVGTPSDNIQVSIQTNSAGSPSGTPIANGTANTIAGSALSSSVGKYSTFSFASAFSLVAGTTYWVVFERTGSLDSSNYFQVGGAVSSSSAYDYASFVSQYYQGTWTLGTYATLLYFEIVPTVGSSYSLWQSDADATMPMITNAMGIVTTTGSAGASGTIYINGIVGGFSGLITGADYYISTTKGTISNLPTGQFLGTAISATQINIPNIIKIGTGWSLGTAFLGVLKAPYNGNYVIQTPASTTSTHTIADNAAITQNALAFNVQTPASCVTQTTIKVRKGQFIQFATTLPAQVIFIPEF